MDIKDGLNCREDFSCQRLMETFPHNTERGVQAPLSQPSRRSWQPFQRSAEMRALARLSALSQAPSGLHLNNLCQQVPECPEESHKHRQKEGG